VLCILDAEASKPSKVGFRLGLAAYVWLCCIHIVLYFFEIDNVSLGHLRRGP